MSMSIKKTQKQYFEEILNALVTKDITHLNDEHNEFLKGRIEALDKKSTSRKPTAEQKISKEISEEVLAFMEPSTLYTATDLWRKVPAFSEKLSVEENTFQRANSIIKDLKDSGKVERIKEGGKAYFRLA